MAETYCVSCDCGGRLRVELYQAGTKRACPSCGKLLTVPNSAKLLSDAGDPYPYLRPIEKIDRAAKNGEPPFEGRCHSCGSARANWWVPITLEAMIERTVAHDGGIRPTVTGGVEFVVAPAAERWQVTTFPLMLCSVCHARYLKSRSRAKWRNVLRISGLTALLVSFVCFAAFHLELIAALSGLLWLIGSLAWVARFRIKKMLPSYLGPWLDRIRWVPEAIAAEDEFRISVARSRAFDPG